MDEAVRAREASRQEIRDITPNALRDVIRDLLAETSTVPGVLALLSAGATDRPTDDADLDARAAGVQLIYLGLSLTRSLARDDPWSGSGGDPDRADMEVLAADVMVSRGFSLLARTEAAETAVETVRAFGRVETERAERPDADGDAHALERDVFELAVIAGATATGVTPSADLREYAVDLARSLEAVPIPDAESVLTDGAVEPLYALSGTRGATGGADDRVWHSSATDS